jgi:hypothetical protein
MLRFLKILFSEIVKVCLFKEYEEKLIECNRSTIHASTKFCGFIKKRVFIGFKNKDEICPE